MTTADASSDSNPGAPGTDAPTPPIPAPKARRGRLRWLRLLAVAGLGFVMMLGMGVGGAEYYTSRPDFCGTCHVMDPYYKSWSHDLHGAKLGVRCVDCHYAPGEKMTFHAKFKGLSQLASYFSGRYGAARPRAHVNDASCLTSGCHGDRQFERKTILIGEPRIEQRLIGDHPVEIKRSPTVHFVHEKHLQVEARLADAAKNIAQIDARLHAALPEEALDRIRIIARSIVPAPDREAAMKRLVSDASFAGAAADAFELMRLEHAQTRLKQLSGLTCTGCHTYDASGANHLTVDRQTCFTCHFTNQAFNHETGECLRCHEPPTRRIAIHAAATTQSAAPALMDHLDIISKGINCASCHADVIQGESRVTARECTHCHDQSHFLDGFASRDTEKVAELHRQHVAAQRARCTDCHRSIEHRLIDATHIAGSGELLKPVVNDCQHCHPSHHREQVQLLMGVGGAGVTTPMPNAMFGSRINCQACHTLAGTDIKGDAVVKGTKAACITCHGDDYENLFKRWVDEIKAYCKEAESSLDRVDKRIAQMKASGQPIPEHVAQIVEEARQNIRLIKAGNGIHNKGYAMQLLDLSTQRLDEAMMRLAPRS